MGKGKRNRDRDKKPQGRRVAGMAMDVPIPRKDASAGPMAFYARVIEQGLHANLFLLNYVAFVADGGFDVPIEHFEPQRDDESDEQYQQRRTAVRMQVEVQAAAGSWKDLCAEELRLTKPSDAGEVAKYILGEGFEWCRDSGFDPSANGYRYGATPLLDALCPAEHRDRASEVLDMFWNEMVFKRPPAIEETAARYPIATIHVAAAMTGWLFSEPACVPDRTATQLKLIGKGQKFADPTGQHARRA